MSKLTLSFKGKTLRVYPALEGEMLIGSDPVCAIHIDSLAVEARHARLVTQAGETVLHDLGSQEGTYVNQARIEECPLRGGEIIRIGKHTLSFTYETTAPVEEPDILLAPPASVTAEPEPSAAPKSAWLQILTGQNLGKTLSLNRAMTNLGKPGVARAVIARRSGGFFLSHLEGPEPQVAERPIGDAAHELRDGDIIQIGNVKMLFCIE